MDFTHNVTSNLAAATILALLAWSIERKIERPQIRHVLWVLVLCKLISPALISFPAWRLTATNPDALPVRFGPLDREVVVIPGSNELAEPLGPTSVQRPSDLSQTIANDYRAPAAANAMQLPWLSLILSVWMIGAIVWFALATVRLFAFGKALRGARVASDEWKAELQFVAGRLGLRRIPQLLLIDAAVPPMVWSFARRTLIILPDALMHQFSASQRRGIIAHELAHLRRGDHWIRWAEFLIVGIYWWNPIAWWARREVHRAEEECCDASVIQAFPEIATDYAQTLLDTVDFLAADRHPKLHLATTFCGFGSLKRRIAMVLHPQPEPQLSLACKVLLGALALGIFPLSLWTASTNGQEVQREVEDQEPHLVRSGSLEPKRTDSEDRSETSPNRIGDVSDEEVISLMNRFKIACERDDVGDLQDVLTDSLFRKLLLRRVNGARIHAADDEIADKLDRLPPIFKHDRIIASIKQNQLRTVEILQSIEGTDLSAVSTTELAGIANELHRAFMRRNGRIGRSLELPHKALNISAINRQRDKIVVEFTVRPGWSDEKWNCLLRESGDRVGIDEFTRVAD